MKKALAILASHVLYGKERSNLEVYALIQKAGLYDITIIASDKADERLRNAMSGFRVLYFDFADRHDTTISRLSLISKTIKSNIALKKIIGHEKADLLLVNNEFTIQDMYWALKSFKGDIVYRLGDAPSFKNRKLSFLNSYIWDRFCIKKVNTFVCISQYIKNKLEETGRNCIKDKIIYNYMPTRNNKETLVLTRNNSTKLTLGFIGQVIKDKGIIELVSAVKELILQKVDCCLYVAGSLSFSKYVPSILYGIIDDSVKDRIILLDEVSDIETFYSSIDVLCVPSIKQEPLGNVLVEAKQFGVPCIVFPSGGMPELIEHKIDGFICAEQTQEALKEGIMWYYNNEKLIPEHKNNSKASIEKLGIDREHFEQKWLDVFKNL